jgi:hypothetical protein
LIQAWSWPHWAIVVVVFILTVVEVADRQHQRLQHVAQTDMQTIESRLMQYGDEAQSLQEAQLLQPVREQWKYVQAISNQYGVDLTMTTARSGGVAYSGPLDAWHGTLQGPVGAVLVAANKMQRAVPVHLYDFNVSGGRMAIQFSVLGGHES